MAKKDTTKTETTKTALPKKLSAKAICGNLKKMVMDGIKAETLKNGDTIELFDVMGVARDTMTGVSDFGDWIGFKGDFQAIRTTDGQRFRSGKCFLPEGASDLIEAAQPSKEKEIAFAFRIGLIVDDTANTLYEYTVESPLEPEQNDAIKRLEESYSK